MHCVINSPIGHLWLETDDIGLKFVHLTDAALVPAETPLLQEACNQLSAYFEGKRKAFDLPLSPAPTDFQERVRGAMLRIPYNGQTTYGEIAASIGCPKGQRAVGQACHINPLMIIVPCHRVVGAHGHPGGFACGLAVKKILQDTESRHAESRGE